MSDDLIKQIQKLIESGKGDTGRLNYILDAIRKGKTLYSSDQKYLDSLLKENAIQEEKYETNFESPSENTEGSNSFEILKNRLARGEITIEEFNELKKALTDDRVTELKDEIKNVNERMERIQEEQNTDTIIKSRGKSESTTLILSLVLGLIGLQGIGHMYVDKVGKGVAILIISLILFAVGIATVWMGIGVILLIIYFILFIWQILDSRKLCIEYNLRLYKSHSPKYSQEAESTNYETPPKEQEHIGERKKSSSKKKIGIVLIIIAAFLGIGAILSAVNYSTSSGNTQQTSGNALVDYSQKVDKWRECAQKNGITACGNPPMSPFDTEPVDCSSGGYNFRCNPYYTETRSFP